MCFYCFLPKLFASDLNEGTVEAIGVGRVSPRPTPNHKTLATGVKHG